MKMYMQHSRLRCVDGLAAQNVRETISTVSIIAREGMSNTQNDIIRPMTNNY